MTSHDSSLHKLDQFTPGMIVLKFVATTIFALTFIDGPILLAMLREPALLEEVTLWILLAVLPPVCGLFGIFWFRHILQGIQRIFCRLFGMPYH